MAIARPSFAGLSSSFGAEWGRIVNEAGDSGGQFHKPKAGRPDEKLGVLVYLPGFGQGHISGSSKLAVSQFRVANRGRRYYALSLQGTFTLGGTNRTWNGPDSLLPLNNNYQWTANQAVTRGFRRTNDGKMYIYTTSGVTASSGPGPTGIGTGIVDGTAVCRCVAIGTNDTLIPDLDFVAGPGRTTGDGIVLPQGVLTEFLKAGYNIDFRYIVALGYSTGAGLADMLGRHYSDIFTHVIASSGCGPLNSSDHNWAVPTRGFSYYVFSGTLDVTVNHNGNPPGPSSAAIGNHPSSQATIENMAELCNGGTPLPMTNTGVTLDMTSTAGSETQVWAPAVDPVDVKGNTLKFRWYKAVGEGHNFSPNGLKMQTETRFVEENGRIP